MACPRITSYRWRNPWSTLLIRIGASHYAINTTKKRMPDNMIGGHSINWRCPCRGCRIEGRRDTPRGLSTRGRGLCWTPTVPLKKRQVPEIIFSKNIRTRPPNNRLAGGGIWKVKIQSILRKELRSHGEACKASTSRHR